MSDRQIPKSIEFAITSPLMKWISQANTWLYRKSAGKFGGSLSGVPVLLLTTRGRKSGRSHTTPLIYLEDGDQLVVVASKGGAVGHPAWYLNLQANPEVAIEQGSRHRTMIASTANGADRAMLWPRLVDRYPAYADYQSWTDREIPVVLLRDPNSN